jgi:hypothetical protein
MYYLLWIIVKRLTIYLHLVWASYVLKAYYYATNETKMGLG